MNRWTKTIIGAVAIILFLGGAVNAQDQVFPSPSGWVNDFAGIMSASEIQSLENALDALEKETGVEFAVVTVETTAPLTVFQYGVELFESWEIGKGSADNGLLVLLAVEDREIRVEVGYGLEPVLTDSRVGAILDDKAMPLFQDGNLAGGLSAAASEFASHLRAAHSRGDLDRVAAERPSGFMSDSILPVLLMAGFWLVAGLFIWFFGVRRQRICPKCKGRLSIRVDKVVSPGINTWGRNVQHFYCPNCQYHRQTSQRVPPRGMGMGVPGRRGMFGGPGRGGSGGGFGGFGGGRSGGGGAGRRF